MRAEALVALALAALLSLGAGPASPVCPAAPVTGEGWRFVDVTEYGVVGDGVTDDRPALQALLDGADDGAVLDFPPGTYRLGARLLMRSNVILQGRGPASVIESVDDHVLLYVGSETAPIRSTAVRDLQLRGPGKVAPTALVYMDRHVQDAWVERCWLIGAGHDAFVALRDCARLCVRDNYVFGAHDDGLNPGGSAVGDGTHDVLLEGNVVEACGQDGIHVSRDSYDVTAIGNEVIACTNGVGFYLTSDATIAENVVRECTNGIVTHNLLGGRLPSPRIVMRDNEVRDCATFGIDVVGDELVLTGNTVANVGVGLTVTGHDAVVEGNRITNAGSYGIKVHGSNASTGFRILGNTVEGVANFDGIFLYGDCGVVSGNVVRDTNYTSIRDQRRYNRVYGNDVDAQVVAELGDANCDRAVDLADLLAVLSAWGPCPGPVLECAADLDGDGLVGFPDVLAVLGAWGS